MSEITIVSVDTPSDMEEFIGFPWKIYGNGPNWVPPLKEHMRRLLDPEQHPFWKFSERILLLARRGSETVGRIAGIIDGNYNRYHKTGMGSWGFFECINDREVSRALFESVEQWVCRRGMTFLRGPLNPSTNYEIGMLVEGFDRPPTFMMPYNPPYYPELVEAAGLRKEKELISYVVDRSWSPPDWMERLGERIKRDRNISIRPIDKRHIQAEVALIKHIYDQCWFKNWGFVPMTDEEAAEMASNLVKFADPDLIFFVHYRDEAVGVGLVVPDINPLLKRLNGKLGLLGLIKALLYRKEVIGLRGLLFGIKDEYRQMGLPFLALDYLFGVVKKKNQYHYLELGWNLDENEAINQLEAEGGAKPRNKYRIYRKSFADRW